MNESEVGNAASALARTIWRAAYLAGLEKAFDLAYAHGDGDAAKAIQRVLNVLAEHHKEAENDNG